MKSLSELEQKIKSEVLEKDIPKVLALLRNLQENVLTISEAEKLVKMYISLSGLDKQQVNANLGTVVNLNLPDADLQKAFSMLSKMANVDIEASKQKALSSQTIIQDAEVVEDLQVETPANKKSKPRKKSSSKKTFAITSLSEPAYDFLGE